MTQASEEGTERAEETHWEQGAVREEEHSAQSEWHPRIRISLL